MKRSYSLFSASSSSSSSFKSQIEYDVFLSFRGEDVRYNFIGHLYKDLRLKGIHTFKDDKNLKKGEFISPELLKTIERSRCSVIVLSSNYASSSWCLDELVKIFQCKEDYEQIVLPIFYHVDLSHVRKQIGSFGEALEKHEQVFGQNSEKVRSWRDALTQVSNLAGEPLNDGVDEAEFVEKFSKYVSKRLGDENIFEDLVGMNSRVKELDDLVGIDSGPQGLNLLNVNCPSSMHDVRFIGICAMGGIGKTTLARVYYQRMSSKFEGSSFLANVREVCENERNGLVGLQNYLLSDVINGLPKNARDVHEGKNMIRSRLHRKKVLIVLDDVDKSDQLKALAGKEDWFGSGSRILLTTRNESLLKSTYKDCAIYKAEELNDCESLRLFSWKAFESGYPWEDYKEQSKQVIKYAKGLPLALEVLGSFLCGKTINEWKSALDRLKEYPSKEIVEVLRISFDGLEETEKNIFLDIACFFNNDDKDKIISIMDSCGFHPTIGIRALIDKSLVHIGPDNKLWMHDLLQEMGKEIVREKSRKEPERWSRIWDLNNLKHVIEKNTGTEQVEAIVVDSSDAREFSWEALSNMKKLRLLFLRCYEPEHENVLSTVACLPNELRILDWHGFPFASLPSSFQPDGLVQLKLSSSKIEHLWNKHMKPLNSLKIIDLRNSKNLRKFEDFGVVPNLEKLILQGCSGLVEVHSSITLLARLTLLDLNYCNSLENLPTSIKGLKSLKVLNLSFCERLSKLPEDLGHLFSLEKLDVGSTDIRCLPSNIVLLKNLKKLTSCGPSENMTNIIGRLNSLKKLDLKYGNLEDGALPEDFGCYLASLEELDLSYNNFSSLPASVNEISKLRILDLSSCTSLKSLGSELPSSLELVWVDKCTSLDTFFDPLNNQCNLRCSAGCLNCFKLVRRQGSKKTAFASLKRYLQNPPNPSREFIFYIPGKEIPTWFTRRSSGLSISLEVDPNWCSSKWMGFALSLIVPGEDFPVSVTTSVKGLGFETAQQYHVGYYHCGRGDHLWLIYFPRDTCFHTKWQNNCSSLEFSFEYFWKNHESDRYGCGVRLVYEQDIQDLNLHFEDDYVDIEDEDDSSSYGDEDDSSSYGDEDDSSSYKDEDEDDSSSYEDEDEDEDGDGDEEDEDKGSM